jgi:hypothetical protein
VVLSNPAGSADSSAPLAVIEPIKFVKPLQDKTVKNGETVVLEAETDRPPRTVKWYKNGDEIRPGQAKTGPGNKLSLEIPNAGQDDAAEYKVAASQIILFYTGKHINFNIILKVVVSDDDGETAESSCALTVLLPGPEGPPKFIRPLVDQTIPEEDELVLEVEIANKPHTVKWYRNGDELVPGTKNVQIEKVNDAVFRLTIPNALLSDSGDYSVEAFNDLGSAKSAAKIIVEPVPEFIRPLRDLEVVEGEVAQFDCLTNLRHPPRKVSWYKNGTEVKPDSRFIIFLLFILFFC